MRNPMETTNQRHSARIRVGLYDFQNFSEWYIFEKCYFVNYVDDSAMSKVSGTIGMEGLKRSLNSQNCPIVWPLDHILVECDKFSNIRYFVNHCKKYMSI